MNNLLNTTENISTLCLCYLDEVDEYLKEIDDSTYFAISPLSVSYKRLYLIGDYIYKGLVTVSASLPDNFESDYEVRLRLGQTYTNVSDFENHTSTVSGNYESLVFKYSNAIPLDVMIYSNNITETHTEVNFILKWDENISNCSNPNFVRTTQTVEDVELNSPVIEVLVNGQSVHSVPYEGITYVLSVINYLRVNTLLSLMDITIEPDNSITCEWIYDSCITIKDNRGLLNIELKGTESFPA